MSPGVVPSDTSIRGDGGATSPTSVLTPSKTKRRTDQFHHYSHWSSFFPVTEDRTPRPGNLCSFAGRLISTYILPRGPPASRSPSNHLRSVMGLPDFRVSTVSNLVRVRYRYTGPVCRTHTRPRSQSFIFGLVGTFTGPRTEEG